MDLFIFIFLLLLLLRVKTTFQERNVEKDKGKSIKLFCDFSQEGPVLIENGSLGYISSPRRPGVDFEPYFPARLKKINMYIDVYTCMCMYGCMYMLFSC